MNNHLDEQELIGYVTHTLTDAQREAMNRHLAACPACRATLDEHNSFHRRLGRELSADLKAARPSPNLHFAAISPQLSRGRHLARLRHASRRLASGAAALLFFAITGWLILQNFAPRPTLYALRSPLGVAWDDHSAFAAGLVPAEQISLTALDDAPVYHVDLSLNDNLTQLTGRQTIRYTNQTGQTLADIYLYLLPNRYGRLIELDEVRADGQVIRPTTEANNTLARLTLPRPLPPGQQLILYLRFTARIPAAASPDSDFFYQDSLLSLAHPFPLVAVYNDGWQTPQLPPYIETPYTEAAWYLVRLSLPSNQLVVASGVEVEREEDHSDHLLTFAAGPARGFYLAASGRFTPISHMAGHTLITAYALPGQEEAAQAQLDHAQQALAAFNKFIGPYPYTELDLLGAPITALRGRAYPGVGLIPQERYDVGGHDQLFGRSQPILLQGSTLYIIAQQYFANAVGSDPIRQPLLSVSLSENLVATLSDPTYSLVHVQPFWEIYTPAITLPMDQSLAGRDAPTAAAIRYGWGPHFFSSLAANMAQPNFLPFLQSYYQAHRWQIASMDSLRQQAEQQCACDLTLVFDKYLVSNGDQ